MNNHPYFKEIESLSNKISDRRAFHAVCEPVFKKMRDDASFFEAVVKQNLSDDIFVNQAWSLYNIPSLYIGETKDFILKYHLFVPLASGEEGVGAACIHHHTNYYLSSTAVFGPGYESFLFSRFPEVDPKSMEVDLRITKKFTQAEWPISQVDSWEPHLVFNPKSLSATLVMWTPDKKRVTDKLRHHPLLKSLKKPLLSVIHGLNMQKSLGVSEKKTYQYYPGEHAFLAIDEDAYFEPTRKAVGPEVDDYSVKTIVGFIQRMGFKDKNFIEGLLKKDKLPQTYQKYLSMLLSEESIGDTYAKDKINIPKGRFTKEEVLRLAGQ